MAKQSTPDPLIGSIIGNFSVLRKLGSGAMGSVYLGEHEDVGKQVAIKILAAHLTHDANMVDRFMLEARAIGILEHPNIVEMFDFGILEDGRCYYTMEYLQGETLSRRMKHGGFSLLELTVILQQVCDALFVIHEKGIIHRDMKPSNIFLAKKGGRSQVKLLDFGIAKIHESLKGDDEFLTTTGAVLGTPVFMSPEQALGQNTRITHLADIYSMGVILYKALSGKFPIVGTTIPEVVTWHVLHDAIPLQEANPYVPVPLARVVMQCLEKDPVLRPATAMHLYASFQEAIAGLDMSMILTSGPPADNPAAAVSDSRPGLHPGGFDSCSGKSGSSRSFLPPPPPPPPPPGFTEDPSSVSHLPGTPELTSHSLMGKGSFMERRKSLALFSGGIFGILLFGIGGYLFFLHQASSGPKPSHAKVHVPAGEDREQAVEEIPRTVKLEISTNSEPADVLVRREPGDNYTQHKTPFELEVLPTETLKLIVIRNGFEDRRVDYLVTTTARQWIHLELEPVMEVVPQPPVEHPEDPPETPAPKPEPPKTPIRPPAPMQSMPADRKPIGDGLL